MKITAVESIRVAIPFTHDGPPSGFASGQPWTRIEQVLVKVDTDQGLTGWGEAFGYGSADAVEAFIAKQLKQMVVGQRADDINGLMDSLKKTLHVFGRSGPVQYALSGLDIALWDLAGKAAGLPLHRLLGGSARTEVEAYASKLRITLPDRVALSCEKAARRGFKAIKLHEITLEAVAAARQAVGAGYPLMMDVNCPWTPAEALAMGRGLQPYDLTWLEEPIWPPENLEALTHLHEQTGIPIAAGENVANAWGFKALVATRGLDIFQPSITKVGGVTEFLQVATLARLNGRQLVPHSAYFGPGFLASLQMAAVFTDIRWIEHLSIYLERSLFGDVGTLKPNGAIDIPQGPGLGADPDPELVSRWRVA